MEFYATFEFCGSYVSFQLDDILCKLTMLEFEIALGLWTVDEQTSVIYTTVICYFTVDISVYWMHNSEMVLLSSSSRRKAPNFFQYSYIFMSFSPTPSPVGPTIRWW